MDDARSGFKPLSGLASICLVPLLLADARKSSSETTFLHEVSIESGGVARGGAAVNCILPAASPYSAPPDLHSFARSQLQSPQGVRTYVESVRIESAHSGDGRGPLVPRLRSRSLRAAGTATINGQVTDESGAVLPGVTVAATSPALQVPQVISATDQEGRYRLTPLPIGTHSVTSSWRGSKQSGAKTSD